MARMGVEGQARGVTSPFQCARERQQLELFPPLNDCRLVKSAAALTLYDAPRAF